MQSFRMLDLNLSPSIFHLSPKRPFLLLVGRWDQTLEVLYDSRRLIVEWLE